jgi:hypothetical protein
MRLHFSESEALRATLLRFAYGESWYCKVSRSNFKIILRRHVVCDLKLLFRELIWFKTVSWFAVLKSIYGGSSHRVARHTGTDIKWLVSDIMFN